MTIHNAIVYQTCKIPFIKLHPCLAFRASKPSIGHFGYKNEGRFTRENDSV